MIHTLYKIKGLKFLAIITLRYYHKFYNVHVTSVLRNTYIDMQYYTFHPVLCQIMRTMICNNDSWISLSRTFLLWIFDFRWIIAMDHRWRKQNIKQRALEKASRSSFRHVIIATTRTACTRRREVKATTSGSQAGFKGTSGHGEDVLSPWRAARWKAVPYLRDVPAFISTR